MRRLLLALVLVPGLMAHPKAGAIPKPDGPTPDAAALSPSNAEAIIVALAKARHPDSEARQGVEIVRQRDALAQWTKMLAMPCGGGISEDDCLASFLEVARMFPADFSLRTTGLVLALKLKAKTSEAAPAADLNALLIPDDWQAIVKEEAAKKWPTNFSMQAFETKKQTKGMKEWVALLEQAPPGMTQAQRTAVFKAAATKWPRNFSMRAYELRKQYKAFAAMR